MRAALLTQYGGQEAITTANDAQKPSVKAGQVLVEVHAAGVNPWDWKVREGFVKQFIPLDLPAVLGGDVAGVVARVGEGVTEFSVGQEVYGEANSVGGHGSFAEFTPVKADQLALKPANIDFISAAALPLAAASAYEAIVQKLNVQAGQTVLIHGGAGGIGSFAIQLAKHRGAHVVTTAKANNSQYVKKLGADEVIDYTTQKFDEQLHDIDAVFDTIGGDTFARSLEIIKPHGSIVSMVEQQSKELAEAHNVQGYYQSTSVTSDQLKEIAHHVEQGELKVYVDKVFPLEQVAEALEYIKTGQHHGKVVLSVKD